MKVLRAIRVFLLCGCSALTLLAQTASISGTVTDSTGGVIPNAAITARNPATGLTRATHTSDSGSYSLPELAAGPYELTIDAAGFGTARFHDIELTVGQAQSVNATLQPQQVNESVQVSATAVAPVELENAQISNVITERQMHDLPLLTRDPYSLVLLSPGTVQSTSSLGGFSVNGARERNNNFLLDGVDNNDTSVPGIPGGLLSLNPEAAQEFRVITNNYLPEYGRNTGAIVDVITRSGSNDFHGDAPWFGRYNALAARDFFNVKGTPQDPFVRNDFGYSFGGPVRRNRTFFFVNDDWQRFNTTLTSVSVVPTAAFKAGKFTYDGYAVDLTAPGAANNAHGLALDPTMHKALSLLPDPNAGAVDDIRGLYRFPSTSRLNTASTTFRLDHQLSQKHSLSLRYMYFGGSDPNTAYVEFAPGLGGVMYGQQTHGVSANLVSALSPTMVNEFRAGVNRVDGSFNCSGVNRFDQVRPADFDIPGVNYVGCLVLGDSNGQARRTGTWSFNEALSKSAGAHSLKFGAEFRRVFENGYYGFGTRPLFTFNAWDTYGISPVNLDPAQPCNAGNGPGCSDPTLQNMAAALFGLADTESGAQFFDNNGQRVASDLRRFRQHEYAGFVQDSWKLRPNLTLSYGMRYEFNGVPYETDNNLSALFANPAGAAPFTFSIVGPGTGRQLYKNDYTGFEPRFGFAWDPFRSGRTSVRGGYGMSHDRMFGNLVSHARGNPPFQLGYMAIPTRPIQLSGLPATSTLVPTATVNEGDFASATIFDSNLRMPVSQNWNFGVQRELPARVTMEINYVGAKANHMFRVVDGNPADPAIVQQLIAGGTAPETLQGLPALFMAGAMGNTALYSPALEKSIANSTYHSLQTNVTRKLDHGLMVQAAWTWAHAIDDASDPLVAVAGDKKLPRNSLNLQAERGNSDFDLRHRLVLNYTWEFPFRNGGGMLHRTFGGWQLSGISVWQSGHPYDIFGYCDCEHTGQSSRPDLIGNPSVPAGADRTQTGPVITAFANPEFGRAGTLGRNTFTGPTFINTNAALIRNAPITERIHAQLRIEGFNVFNRPQFAQPGNLLANPYTFGVSTSTIVSPDGTTSARQLQVALKLMF